MSVRSIPRSVVAPGHADWEVLSRIRTDIEDRLNVDNVRAIFARRVMDAVDFVLDPVRTGRTRLSELDKVEKTFIGLKVEHFVRDMLDAPQEVRDLKLAGYDVDVKTTTGASWGWMIPLESYGGEEPCLLIAADEERRLAWMGLLRARLSYLGRPNRDAKRRVLKAAFSNILWLVEAQAWPPSPWATIDMSIFSDLRAGGLTDTEKVAALFREHLRRPIHRSIIQALIPEQHDYMNRIRRNGGARDILAKEGVAILGGTTSRMILGRLRMDPIDREEFIAVEPRTADERAILLYGRHID